MFFRRLNKKQYLATTFISLFIIGGLGYWLFTRDIQEAVAWWNDGWYYRQSVTVTNSGAATTNQFVKITLDTSSLITAGKLQADCDDIRVVDNGGKILDNWDVSCNSASTLIYTKLADLPAGDTILYIYYGNPSATNIERPLGTALTPGTSCQMMKNQGSVTSSGLYYVTPGGNEADKIQVYCDMTTDSAGWTLVLNHVSTATPGPNPTWAEVENNVNTTGSYGSDLTAFSLFLGVKHWNYLGNYIRVEVGTAPTAITKRYDYTSFSLNTGNYYALTMSGQVVVSGTPAPGIYASHNNQPLTTKDADHDTNAGNCANNYNYAWWYTSCWSGSFWGSTVSHQDRAFWVGSTTDYHNYGGLWLKGTDTMKNATAGSPSGEEKGPAPSAYWKLDEGMGTTAYNSTSTSNINGTISGATWQTEDKCVSGKCLYQSAAAEQKTTISTNITSGWTASNDFTMSMWFNCKGQGYASDANPQLAGLFIHGTSAENGTGGFYLRQGSTTCQSVQFYVSTAASHNSITATLTSGQNKWSHLVTVKSGDTLYIYENGVLKNSQTFAGASWYVNVNLESRIGNVHGRSVKGMIDDVKVYPYARTSAQILQDYNAGESAASGASQGASASLGASSQSWLSDGLVAHWKGDEASGNATDSSGNGNTATVAGSSNYGTGKFGNGLRTGVATTNLTTNPSVETGTTGWSCWHNVGTGACVRSSDTGAFGSYSWKSTMTLDGSQGNQIGDTSVSASTVYSVSAWVNITSWGGSNFTFYMREYYPTGNGQCGSTLYTASAVTNGWVRITGTCTTRADTTLLSVSYYLNSTLQTVYTDGVQIEQVASSMPYVDGSLGTGYAWSGTAHASTSTRAASTAAPASLVDNTSGTVAFWFNSPSLDTSAQCPFGSSNGDSTGGVFFSLKSSGIYAYHNYATSQSLSPQYVSAISNNTWYQAVYTWDNSTRSGTLYVNGLPQQTVAYTQAITIGAYIQNLGTCTKTSYTAFNGTLDDMRVYSRALEGAEVAKLYSLGPAPVGYWKMDDALWNGTANEAADSSGAGNYMLAKGTTGTATIGVGHNGSAGKFIRANGHYLCTNNGSGTTCADDNDVDITGDLTVGFWLKAPSTSSTTQVPVAKYSGCGYEVVIGAGGTVNLGGRAGDCGSYTSSGASTTSVYDNNWHYISATRLVDKLSIYIDGRLENSATVTTTGGWSYANAGALVIGAETTGAGNAYDGFIDDVRIYNYARTPQQVLEDMNTGVSSQTIGYWKFDDSYGTTAVDSSGVGNNGTLNNSPTWTNMSRVGGALSFNGSAQYVEVNMTKGLTSAETMSTWFKPTNGSHTTEFVYSTLASIAGDGANPDLGTHSRGYLYMNASNNLVVNRSSYSCGRYKVVSCGSYFIYNIGGVCYGNYDSVTYTGTKAIQNNEWNYAAVTMDYSQMKMSLYLNGELLGSAQSTPSSCYDIPGGVITKVYTPCPSLSCTSNSTYEWIGRHKGSASYTDFTGQIDEFKHYNYVLSADDIRRDMNQNAGAVLGRGTEIGDTGNAPIAWWKLDENTSTTANDSSNNGNTGTLTNGPTWAPGKLGSAVSMDSTKHVSLGAAKFDTLTNATVEMWFNYTGSFDTTRRLFDRTKDANNRQLLFVSYSGGYGNKLVFENIVASANRSVVSNTTINADTWYHVAFVCGTGGMKMYLNGVQQASTNATTDCFSAIAATTANTIGYTSNSFVGRIDNVKIYDYVRSQTQIAYDYNRGQPMAYWKLDDGSGASARDEGSQAKSVSLTIGGGGTQTTTSQAWTNGDTGKYGKSLNFDGSDDFAANNSGGFLPTGDNPRTIAFWFKPVAGMSTTNGAVAYGCSTAEALSCADSGAGRYLSAWANTSSIGLHLETCQVNGPATPAPTTDWHHYTAVFNGDGTVTFYIDGQKPTTVTAPCTINTAAGVGVSIGVGRWGYYNGQIDDVRIYNYARTADQVKQDMLEGAAVRF
jgi:hypothetical protein